MNKSVCAKNKSISTKHKAAFIASLLLICCLAMGSLVGCGSPAQTEEQPEQQNSTAAAEKEEIKVNLVVDSSSVDNPVSYNQEISIPKGSTVQEALMATDLDVQTTPSSYGDYVSGIDGLVEMQHGDTSGWLFTVNDEMAMESASTLVVNEGDKVTWKYVTEFE